MHNHYCFFSTVPHTPYTVIIIALNDNDDQGPPASLDFFSKEGSELYIKYILIRVALIRDIQVFYR